MFAWLTILTGVLVFAAACPQAPPPEPPDTRAEDEAALREADANWSKVTGEKNVDGFVSFFTDDGMLFPPNQAAVSGKEAIHHWGQAMVETPGFAVSWQATKAEAARSSDLGYTVGTYEMTVNDAKGKPVTEKGKYLTVWKKQADGSWKVAVDTFNSDMPAAPQKR
jgi:ketosteroid isomerase-like protein